jgi:hypothetical protein
MDNLEFLSIVLIQHGNYFSRGYEIPLKKNKGRTLFGCVFSPPSTHHHHHPFVTHNLNKFSRVYHYYWKINCMFFSFMPLSMVCALFHRTEQPFFFIMFIIVVSQILWSWIFIMLRAMWNDLSRYFSGTIFFCMCFAHVLFNYFIANFL